MPPVFAMQNYPFSSNFSEKIAKFVIYCVGSPADNYFIGKWIRNRHGYASGN